MKRALFWNLSAYYYTEKICQVAERVYKPSMEGLLRLGIGEYGSGGDYA